MGKISHQEMIAERKRIEKWIKNETKHILGAKKNIWKGYNEVKGIMGKIERSNDFEDLQQSRSTAKKNNKMMKCLSDKYITRKSKLIQKQKS